MRKRKPAPVPAPTPELSQPAGDYLFMPRSQLMALPTSGTAWDYVLKIANSTWPVAELDDQDNKLNAHALAGALVYARTGDSAMRTKARNAITAVISTYNLSEDAGLGPARQIAGWVLAADLIGLDGTDDTSFRSLLNKALTSPIGTHGRWGGSLRICHNDANNNWGAFAGASRIAAERYLGRSTDEAERVFRGYFDRAHWNQFRGQGTKNGALYAEERPWACDDSPEGFVPVNGACTKSGINLDGAIVGDVYRDKLGLVWPVGPIGRSYTMESLQGLALQAELLGLWLSDMRRVGDFAARAGAWNFSSVSYHVPWLFNARLGTSYPTLPAQHGRAFGYCDWLYGGT